MFVPVVIVTFLATTTTQGLECGIHVSKNEALKRTLTECVRNNKSMEELWGAAATMSWESDSSSSSEENTPTATTPPQDGKIARNFRLKKRSAYTHQRQESPPNKDEGDSEEITNNTKINSNDSENCVLQCVFDKLELTDATGFPQHAKLLESLSKSASGPEFRDFITDTLDDCYQQLEKEHENDPCEYSTKLLACLAEKGKNNCADWPVGELPTFSSGQ